LKQFLSFLGVGSLATSIHYAVLIALVELFLFSPVVASVVGALAGAIVGYYLNRNFTFKAYVSHKVAMPKFMTVALMAVAGNFALMSLFVETLSIPYLFGQIITTVLLVVVTFGLNKAWSFKNTLPDAGPSS